MRPAHLLILMQLMAAPAVAQQISVPAEITESSALPQAMTRFAKAVIASQQAGRSQDPVSLFLMSRLLPPGSRLVAVLCIIKEPGREINYGTGGAVIDESIADAKTPLKISWFGSSYLDLPVHR